MPFAANLPRWVLSIAIVLLVSVAVLVGRTYLRPQETTLISITVSPGTAALPPGGTQQFSVSGVTSLGTTFTPTVTWSSTGGAITTSGLYTADATTGAFRVIARAGSGQADTASVVIGAPPPPPPAASAGGGPDEPGGCQPAYEDGFSALGGSGLTSSGVGSVTVSGDPRVTATLTTPDLTAPQSPPNVLQVSFAPGWIRGTAPPPSARRPLTASYFSLFIGFWLRLDPPWPGPDTGPDIAVEVASGSTAGERVSIRLGRVVGGSFVADLRLAGLSRPFGGAVDPTLAANLATSPAITRGVWHRVELLVVANGTAPQDDGELRWWFDGKAVGAYSGLGFFGGPVPAIREIGWSAIAPVAALASQQSLRMDHWYVSGWTGETGSGTGQDLVALVGDAPPATGVTLYGAPTTLMLDAKRQPSNTPPCDNDFNAAPLPWGGDLRFRGSCRRDEIVVFSVGDRATLDEGSCGSGTIWTDEAGQARKEQLGVPPIKVPVKLWTVNFVGSVYNKCMDITNGNSDGGPTKELATATDTYDGHSAGIVFQFVDSTDLCPNPGARTALAVSGTGSDCSLLDPALPFFQAGMINVYYVQNLLGNNKGINCRSVDPNIILISVSLRNATTLAHELGHALGLEHTGYFFVDADPGRGSKPLYDGGTVGGDNLMWANGPAKYRLTLGQAFRMNFESLSQLNRNALRKGSVRACECRLRDGACTESAFKAESQVDGVCPGVPHPW